MAKKQKSLSSDPVADVTVEPQTKKETKMGRPSIYTEELAHEICVRLGSGESLRKICLDERIPHIATVMSWLTKKPDFLEQYTRAREIQAETQFDELIDIVDQPPELSHITNKDGELIEVKFDSSYVQWMKLRVDTRKWTAARMAPKKYAEYRAPDEKVDSMVIDGEIKTVMDVAIKRLELIRIAE
jgi:hypothetical protein